MSFGSPWLLSLLVPVIGLAVWDAARRWRGASSRRGVAIALRAGLVAALVVAAADPRVRSERDAGYLIVLLDRSASLSDDALADALQRADGLRDAAGDDRVGLIAFGATAEVIVPPGRAWDTGGVRRRDATPGTDLAAAVRLGLGLIPPGAGGRIVLLSDGRHTGGDLDAAVAQAQRRGVPLHALAVDPARDDPAVVLVAPDAEELRPGATLTGTVQLEGAQTAVRGSLTVTVGGAVAVSRQVTLEPGEGAAVEFEHAIDTDQPRGPLVIEAVFAPEGGDRDPSNNRATAPVMIDRPPRVVVIEGEKHIAEPLVKALRAEQMEVEVIAPERARRVDLDDTDLVVLANAPALAHGEPVLPTSFLDRLNRWVSGGGGLIVLGGPQAYELGGYGSTPLARVLPVELDPVVPEVDTAVTLIVILDQSGSMGMPVGRGKNKLDLANEGAAASIRLLRPFDHVGVMSVTDRVRWQVKVQPAIDREAMERKVLGIPVSDAGIYVYTSLVEARSVLAKAETPHKHIILFSDADDSEEQVKGIIYGWGPGPNSYELARDMRKKGITLSVIGIGTPHDQDAKFLKQLAAEGGGRYYLTNDAHKLKAFFVKETERLVESSLIERGFRPRPVRAHAGHEGIDFDAGPKLTGMHDLRPRDTAEVVLLGPDDKPVMTTWQYGLGQVVAWSSDAGLRWSEDWLEWDGYARYWTQLARWSLRRHEGDDAAVEIAVAGQRAVVRIARRNDDGMTMDAAGVRAVVARDGGERELELRAPEPGMFVGELPVEPGVTYTVRALDRDGTLIAERAFAAPPPPELRHRTADRDTLAGLAARTGGSTEPAAAARSAGGVLVDVRALWPFLLALALLLLPVDAYLRRAARVV